MSTGLHIVKSARKGKPVRWYIYAWRGGPCIHSATGGERPKLTPQLMEKAAEAFRTRSRAPKDKLSGLIEGYRASPEWLNLATSTQAGWLTWLQRIGDKFGKAPLAAFEDRRMRGDVLAWRDQWQATPRAADLAMQVFSRLLSWGVDRGRLGINILIGVASLYDHDRSDLIWETEHFERFNAHASVEVQEAIELAACTGLRRGDLAKLPWDAVGENAIIWKTAKSRGKQMVVIPLLPETRALLDRIKARHAAEMAVQRPSRRKPLPATVLANSRWRPWTASGLGSRFNDAKVASGVDRNLHDVRGTFVTRCCNVGLTDDEIGKLVGWSLKDVSVIRQKYCSDARVLVALAERMAIKKPAEV